MLVLRITRSDKSISHNTADIQTPTEKMDAVFFKWYVTSLLKFSNFYKYCYP